MSPECKIKKLKQHLNGKIISLRRKIKPYHDFNSMDGYMFTGEYNAYLDVFEFLEGLEEK